MFAVLISGKAMCSKWFKLREYQMIVSLANDSKVFASSVHFIIW